MDSINPNDYHMPSFYCVAFSLSLIAILVQGYFLSMPATGAWRSLLPLVGDLGDRPPATSMFQFIFTFVGIFWIIITTIRYFQMRALVRHNMFHDISTRFFYKSELPEKVDNEFLLVNPHIQHFWRVFNELNGYNYCLSFVLMFAFFGYGVFDLNQAPLYHNLFAALIATCSIVYCSIDGYVSYITSTRISAIGRHNVRATAVCLMIFFLVVALSSGSFLVGRMGSKYFDWRGRQEISWNHPGFCGHFMLSLCEYSFIIAFAIYVYTLAGDFHSIDFMALQTKFHFEKIESSLLDKFEQSLLSKKDQEFVKKKNSQLNVISSVLSVGSQSNRSIKTELSTKSNKSYKSNKTQVSA